MRSFTVTMTLWVGPASLLLVFLCGPSVFADHRPMPGPGGAVPDAGASRAPSEPVTQPARAIEGRDGASMVFIQAGLFWMGSTDGEMARVVGECKALFRIDEAICKDWFEDEAPRHRVELEPFYLDRIEITNLLFENFVQTTGYRTTAEREGKAKAWVEGKGLQEVKGANWQQPEGDRTVFVSNRHEHPVVTVSWQDADAYCRWAGKRLPTEAEWEYAARAGTQTRFWWGDGHPGLRRVGNLADESARHLVGAIITGYRDGYARTAPAGSYEPNPWGLHDMIGNAAEWTSDWYGGNYEKSLEQNPKGPSSGKYKVIRGGSWANGLLRARSANRDWDTPIYRHDTIGFRCAKDVTNDRAER